MWNGACRSASRGCGWRRSSPARPASTYSVFARETFPAVVFAAGLDAPARVRRAGGVARARRRTCRLVRRAPLGQPVRAGANRPGLGSAASGRRAARRNRASSVRAGSRSLRPRLAAAVARSGSHRCRRRHPAGLAAASRVAGRYRRAAGRRRRTGTGARMARALRRARPAGLRSAPRGARRVPALGREPGTVHGIGAPALAGGRRADHRSDLAADPAALRRRDLRPPGGWCRSRSA